ncbi:hypothetical protein [Sphingomonas elodea]|uniref:hypothetical protein n=1 Tax=Sphingomonas elodea TaxID=179878 RepID=UPI0011106FCC|nr:hypothetical protein [Sphingomonas elodea]
MEQTSLTYTSRTTMGVGVAGGTPDTPGLDVNIGFKEANVALVPVAVAKYCYKSTGAQCQNPIYKMEMIAGGKFDAIQNSPIEKRISEFDREIQQFFDQQKADDDNRATLAAGIALVEAADAADSELLKLGPAAADDTPEKINARKALAAKAAVRPANFDATKSRKEIAQLDASKSTRSERLNGLLQQKSNLLGQLNANTDSKRTDAFSVYGRFSGAANGDSGGAGLTAGKVFATGVAAQNITEFATLTECLSNIRVLAEMLPKDSADRASLLKSTSDLCRRTK